MGYYDNGWGNALDEKNVKGGEWNQAGAVNFNGRTLPICLRWEAEATAPYSLSVMIVEGYKFRAISDRAAVRAN